MKNYETEEHRPGHIDGKEEQNTIKVEEWKFVHDHGDINKGLRGEKKIAFRWVLLLLQFVFLGECGTVSRRRVPARSQSIPDYHLGMVREERPHRPRTDIFCGPRGGVAIAIVMGSYIRAHSRWPGGLLRLEIDEKTWKRDDDKRGRHCHKEVRVLGSTTPPRPTVDTTYPVVYITYVYVWICVSTDRDTRVYSHSSTVAC